MAGGVCEARSECRQGTREVEKPKMKWGLFKPILGK